MAETKSEAKRKRKLEDLDSEVLSAIEGGEGTSFDLLSVPQDNSVSWRKQNFMEYATSDLNLFDGIYYPRWVDSITGYYGPNAITSLAIIPIRKYTNYDIRTVGSHNRFTLTLMYAKDDYGERGNIIHVNNETSGNESFSFGNRAYNFLMIGVSNANETPQIIVNSDDAILIDKEVELNIKSSMRKLWVNYITSTTIEAGTNRAAVFELPPDSEITVRTVGYHDRFTVSVSPSLNAREQPVEVLYRGANDDAISTGDEEFSFFSGSHKYLIVGLSSTGNEFTPDVFISFTSKNHIKLDSRHGSSEVTVIQNRDTGITQTKEIYPVMFAVKTVNEKQGETPRPVGWLYYHPETFKMYYANGTPDNMKYLCDWDKSVTWNGSALPSQYRPFITKDGDIIFVWRGDLLGTEPGSLNVRQDPIVYPSGGWDNPVSVPLTGEKPTSWLQNCGADFLYSRGEFIFAEYTRPSHENAHVWKVTEPFTRPENWRIVKSEVLSGSNGVGMKHFHTINYDPFSQSVFLSSGDDSSAAKIYRSDDFGETFNVVREGSEKYCRLLNFVFTKDKIYWATDSGKPDLHFFFSVGRDSEGIPDFDNITEHYQFPNKSGEQATYVTALIEDKGVLFLDRYDGTTTEPMEIYFWDFKTLTMDIIGLVGPMDGVASTFGFRVEAINWYQQKGGGEIVLGFGNPPNATDLLGNSGASNVARINNYALSIENDGSSYKIKVRAIPFRE